MQIILNLQSNALKFTRAGFVRIYVEILDIGNDLFLKISVEDSGAGVPYEH